MAVRFKPSSKIFLLTVPKRYFFCGSFVFSCVLCFSCFRVLYCCLVVTCWERAILLALVGNVYCVFVTFPCGILGQVWYLIVSYPDLCRLSYFKQNVFQYISNTSFSTFAIFFSFEEIEPMCVIHNISIATDGDIIQFGDDVNIYPVYLSKEIIIWGNCRNWLEKTTVSDHIFCQFLVS